MANGEVGFFCVGYFQILLFMVTFATSVLSSNITWHFYVSAGDLRRL